MTTRTQSHQLSNGLVVSGHPDTNLPSTPRATSLSSRAAFFSGDLSSMPASKPPSRPNSGSGPLPLLPTGLITSGSLSLSSGPNLPATAPGTGKMVYGAAVTSLAKEEGGYGVRVSRVAMWVFGVLVVMGLLVGVFVMVSVKKALIFAVIGAVLVLVFVVLGWNYVWMRKGVLRFVNGFPDTELTGAVDGQFVKVTGVVTCGSIPLESSFQRETRCVYVSTELHEYKGWGGKPANPKHRCFSWGSRHSEKYVADFYISDLHTGLRALVKSGYGAKVATLVETSTAVNITNEKRDISPNFLQWLADRSLSSDDRVMRLKEGYVKEGSTVSVMGVVRRHENIVMIVPPVEPISTGCQWLHCLLPMYVEGLILHCEENHNSEVIPV